MRKPSARWTTIRLLPRVSRPLSAAVGASVLMGGLLPIGFMFASGALIAAVPGTIRGGFGSPEGRRLIVALAVAAGFFVLEQVLEPFRILLAQTLGRRLDLHLRGRVMRACLEPPGVAHLEDPAQLDTISLARGVGPGDFTPASAVVGLAGIGGMYVQGVVSAVVVARTWWWLAIGLLAVNLYVRLRFRGELVRIVDVMLGKTRALRRSNYFRDLVLLPGSAKETRIFGLRRWIVERFNGHWLDAMRQVWRERAQSRGAIAAVIVVFPASYFVAFAMIGRAGVRGAISIGTIAVLLQAVNGINVLSNISDAELLVVNGVAAVPAVLELERSMKERPVSLRGVGAPDGMPRREIRFEGVTFRYPGTEHEVFRGLDLAIPAGRSLAIVGPNGAGKTTLAKLLARLYDPSDGRIAVDGTDLRDLDPRAWQRRIAAIFQDFVQYQLPAADNVGFGAVERAADRDAIAEAARRAGAAEIVEALPLGWDTVLSRQYKDGADLSGGEWQRLALARALFAVQAGAGVLVLDEPTANLDVRAEVELFDRFLDLTRGLTTILISHRFSTVRRAEHIVVLESGRVTELGSHEELLALDGTYAHMFRLQAARFAEPEAVDAQWR